MRLYPLFVLLLVGCGSANLAGKGGDKSSDSPVPAPPTATAPAEKHSLLVADATALPACDAAGEGWLVYLQAEAKFQSCAAGAWADVPIPIAVAGKDGAAGKDGKAGVDNRIVTSTHCGGELDGTGILVEYSVAEMASGDVFATASIASDSFQASGTNFFSSQQVGALIAAVIVSDDLQGAANAGFWTVALNRKTLVSAILYTDADAAGGKTSFTLPTSDCSSNKY